jgi:membrane associated rhomboid family serine protease
MTHNFQASRPSRRERAINSPWIVTSLIFVLVLAHAARLGLHGRFDHFAATSVDLAAHRILPFVTYQFVHGSWAHVLLNAAFILAFGAPVARFMGEGARGSLVFLIFFLVCGVIAGVGYGWLIDAVTGLFHAPRGEWALAGASGASSGLMGGAVRLMQGHGRLGPLRGRTVASMSAAWIVINSVRGVAGVTPGAGQLPVAWEAHIIGYFAGLLLVGGFSVLAGVRQPASA